MVLHMVRGERIEQRELIRRLTEMQYTRNDTELRRATYRVRGEVIDVHPAESDAEALRIELFDGEIENLTMFDPLTGETLRKVPRSRRSRKSCANASSSCTHKTSWWKRSGSRNARNSTWRCSPKSATATASRTTADTSPATCPASRRRVCSTISRPMHCSSSTNRT
jgi:transcription-repair coupling factor (superfamily II helicase)